MAELSQTERTARKAAWEMRLRNIVDCENSRDFSAGWDNGRDYGRERERALEAAIEQAGKLCVPGSYEAIRRILRAALPASLGEPEGQASKIITKPDEFRRFLEWPGCGMKRLFSPYEGRCDECRSQPDHGPREPGDPKRCTYCGGTFPTPVELHHAEADCCGPGEPSDDGERRWLIVERSHGRVDKYEFEDETAARSGAVAYIRNDDNQAIAVRVQAGESNG